MEQNLKPMLFKGDFASYCLRYAYIKLIMWVYGLVGEHNYSGVLRSFCKTELLCVRALSLALASTLPLTLCKRSDSE